MGFEEMISKNVHNVIRIIDACLQAYFYKAFDPTNGVTYCNQAVQFVASKIGCNDFSPSMNADAMVTHMKASTIAWTSIAMADAQASANAGNFVIAGLTSQDMGEEHGHVAIVRPSTLVVFSGKWSQNAPILCNIGKEKLESLINGCNDAFGPKPNFFVWKNPLDN